MTASLKAGQALNSATSVHRRQRDQREISNNTFNDVSPGPSLNDVSDQAINAETYGHQHQAAFQVQPHATLRRLQERQLHEDDTSGLQPLPAEWADGDDLLQQVVLQS